MSKQSFRLICINRSVVMVLFFIFAQLPPASAQPVSKEALESCRGYSNVAAAIMEKRQKGARMSDMMDALSAIPEQPDLSQRLVREAYSEPIWQSVKRQSQAVSDFRDRIYSICFDSLATKERDM